MPAINPKLVPTINPGDLFERFTTDDTLNIRWLSPTEPVYWGVFNRPLADLALRQLIISKAVDDLDITLGYQAIFPFIIPPTITDGTSSIDLPIRIFWDMHVSVPVRWINVRLARIDRLDGDNNGTDGYTGTLRFIFTAQQEAAGTGAAEIALFYADYTIDSDLTYQRTRISPATTSEVSGFTVVSPGEHVTLDGELVFRTLDVSQPSVQAFFDFVAPGVDAKYEISDSSAVGTGPSFDDSMISHGTGMLTSNAVNLITPVDADPITWLEAFNYPFDMDVSLEANDASGIEIPKGLFKEFDITAPAGDEPTGDTSTAFFPVWISKIEKDVTISEPTLKIFFATRSIEPDAPSEIVEFATMTLSEDMPEGEVVAITPNDHLFVDEQDSRWHQEFGRGNATLSSKWGATGGEVSSFFANFPTVTGAVSSVSFDPSGTRLSAWAVSRVPKYTPTSGQSEALRGTSARRATPVNPSDNNRYVTEQDEGLGDIIDLNAETGISSHNAIDRYGYSATRSRKMVKLVVDPEKASDNGDPDFYQEHILPRLRVLLGRDPKMGDEWFTGQRFLKFTGDAWLG